MRADYLDGRRMRNFRLCGQRRRWMKQSFQGSFNFCRAMFQSNRREKRGWSTDYPGADLNFSTRLAELTKAPVTMRQDADEDEAPDAVVVRLTECLRREIALYRLMV